MMRAVILVSVLLVGNVAKLHGPPQQVLDTKASEADLMHFLISPIKTFAEFQPQCLDHVRGIIETVDQSYTDMQLERVLKNECALAKEFKLTVSHGFGDHDACLEFAEMLTKARREHLRTGSQDGYKEFCKEFFLHKGGVIQEDKPDEKTSEAPKLGDLSAPFIAITLLACLAFVLIAYLYLH